MKPIPVISRKALSELPCLLRGAGGGLAVALLSGGAFAEAAPPQSATEAANRAIPAYRAAAITSVRAGEPAVRVRLSDPVVVSVAPEPESWGFFQFPKIARLSDGTICATWHMLADSILSYGKPDLGSAFSPDGGKTWNPSRGVSETGGGLLLPNGDQIKVITPLALKATEIELPKPIGAGSHTYEKSKLILYRLQDLPPSLRGVYLSRLRRGERKWVSEPAALDDPQALRYSLGGLLPVLFWGDLQVSFDGSIFAGIYPGYGLRDDGSADPKCGVFFYRSADQGHSWRIQGRITYQPDMGADPQGNRRMGFTEPAFEILADGTFLCVMRTTDGIGLGPLTASHSSDQAATWTRPEVIARRGVLPRLLLLANGVLVLSAGRPGVQLRFCPDGQGKAWTSAFEMLPYGTESDQVSCGYTGLLATGPDRFILIYSDFRYLNQAHELRKAIKVREIVVTQINPP